MSSQATAHADKPLIGIALMIAFCMIIPFGDALIKILSDKISVMTLLLVRFAMQAILLWPIVLWQKGGFSPALDLSPRVWRLLTMRTVLHMLGIAGMFFALYYLPLADATAIAFIFPLVMLFLGKVYLGEHVGPHRLYASIIGFVGILLVVQPNFIQVGWPALWPAAVAVSFAFFMMVTRKMSKDIDPISIQAVSGTIAVPMLLILILLAWFVVGDNHPDLSLKWPEGDQWWYLIGAGLMGTYAHLLMTWSLRFAPSTTLAPLQYLEIPFATLIGWLIFSDFPNELAAVGIAVTIATGLYIIYREQKSLRAAN